MNDLIFQQGLPERYRASAAILYDEAFGPKLSVAIRSEQERLALLKVSIMLDYAIVAIAGDELAGLAGFHTETGSFTGGFLSGGAAFRYLVSHLGWIKGSWAVAILGLYERKPAPGDLLMDGIAVRSDFRGRGIGSKLLDEITRYAGENGFTRVRLDVIDTNPGARRLYERKGFEAIGTGEFTYLRWLLGFSSATTMVLEVEDKGTGEIKNVG